MFKILKGSEPETYTITCYYYVREANFYSFLYSARNISFDTLAGLLQGRLSNTDDLEWITAIISLTKQPAIIGEDGVLRTVPLHQEKGVQHETRKTETFRKRGQGLSN